MSGDSTRDMIDAPESFEPVELATEVETGLLEKALKAAGSDAARYIPVRFVPALTSLITTPLFTRAIDKADYGAFYLVSAVASLLSALAVGWLQSSVVRFYWPSKKSGRMDAYVSTVVWAGLSSLLFVSALAGAAVWLGGDRLEDVVVRLVPAAIAYTVFSFYETLLLQVLRAANRASAYAIWSTTATIVVTAVGIVLVWFAGWGAMGILVGAAIGNAVVLPFILREMRQEGSLSPRSLDRPLLGELVTYGAPLVPVGLAGWALVVLDRFVISSFRGPAEVGLYSVAYGLGDKIMQLATMPLMLTMMPSLTEAYERQGQALAEKIQSHFTRYFLILTLPMLVGLTAAAETFMNVFTGPEYRRAFFVLPLVAAGSMLGSLSNIAGTGLGMHKRTTLIMGNTIAASVLNLGLNVMLVPRYGFMAAAVDTVAAYALLLTLTWLQSRRYMRWIIPWGSIARVAAAAALMGAAVWGLSQMMAAGLVALVVQVGVGVVLYPLLLVLFGGLKPNERQFILALARRGLDRLRKS